MTTKGNYHVGIFLKEVFSSAEHQDKCSYGLGYKLTLHRLGDFHVLGHPFGAKDAANLVLVGRVIR